MGPRPRKDGERSNRDDWWTTTVGLHRRNEVHESQMKHNAKAGVKGDDMRSDATDEAGYAGIAEDVDPMALVGWKVNLPAECFFQDDAIPDDSAPTGVGEIRRYFPGRRNKTRHISTC